MVVYFAGMRSRRTQIWLPLTLLTGAACPDPTCPSGTRFLHGACIAEAETETDASGDTDTDTDADSDTDADTDADTDVTTGPWTGPMMFRSDVARTGVYPGKAPSLGEVVWTAPIGAACSTPSISEGRVYLATDLATVYALDLATGAELWSFEADGPVGPPAVDNGRVVFGDRRNNMYGLSAATGELLWRTIFENDCGPVALDADAVTVVCGSLYVLDPADGQTITSVVIEDGDVLQGVTVLPTLWVLGDGPLRGYSRTDSTELWSASLANTTATGASDGETVFVPTLSGMVAIGTNQGGIVWSEDAFATLDSVSPALADGVVYFATTRGLRAREALGGTELWTSLLADQPIGGIAVAGDVAFAADASGTVHAISRADGVVRWSLPTGACAGPALADGTLLVGTPGGLTAVQ